MDLRFSRGSFVLTFGANEELPLGLWGDLVKWRAGYECQGCGKPDNPSGRKALLSHHKMPLSRGGITSLPNGLCACTKCHAQRHTELGRISTRKRRAELGIIPSITDFYDRLRLNLSGVG